MAYFSVLGIQRYVSVVEINGIVVDQRNQRILSAVSHFANISSINLFLVRKSVLSRCLGNQRHHFVSGNSLRSIMYVAAVSGT